MAGGIQKGTEAGSVESKELDNFVKNIALKISKLQNKFCFELGHEKKKRLPELDSSLMACVPDGGMWFDGDRTKSNRKLKYVFEAKKQGTGGNAIERWFKNYFLCHNIDRDMSYITFMIGAGAADGEVLHSTGTTVKSYDKNAHFHYSVDGFSEKQIFDIMINHLKLNITYEQLQTVDLAQIKKDESRVKKEQAKYKKLVEKKLESSLFTEE
jgi:hypothetical protein